MNPLLPSGGVELKEVVMGNNMLTPKEKMLQIIKEELFYREFYRESLDKKASSKTKKSEDTKNEDIKKRT